MLITVKRFKKKKHDCVNFLCDMSMFTNLWLICIEYLVFMKWNKYLY